MASSGHRQTGSVSQNHKAQLASAYNELGKELSSHKIRVVGNYTLGKVIGEGTYGKVRMGIHRLTGTRVAIKQIPKAMTASLTREIHHHRQLHHPHVTQLFEVIATENNIWLVTELCSGGELFDYLAEKGRLGEDETRVFFGQLCLAVAYVHEKGIVHRDLKLENVLLDERCRVKLGDFGFTREFERGVLLETYCGTTGYASPEMLLSQKYLGPEVDVWSLGVILYTMLTGTLPFDDDDESVMRSKVIKGEFEDPEWLSDDARDLLKCILQVDPTKRSTIAQILSHSWFTSHNGSPALPPAPTEAASVSRSASPTLVSAPSILAAQPVSLSSTASDSTFHSASSEVLPSTPSTPAEPLIDFLPLDDVSAARRDSSESTVRGIATPHHEYSKMDKLPEEEEATDFDNSLPEATPMRPSLSRNTTSRSSSRGPPAMPIRTPARTKRRSVSSTLSDHSSPTFEKPSTSTPQDFSSLLSTPAPLIFSTLLERELLNNLCSLGFDTGQIVHSVLADACDATGALWWMMKRRAERRALEDGVPKVVEPVAEQKTDVTRKNDEKEAKSRSLGHSSREDRSRSPIPPLLVAAHSAPELQLIPATPTAPSSKRAISPPRAMSPSNPMLSPSPTPVESVNIKSHPSTPSGSMKDKDGSKGRKTRAGSVSIMQRATTALEAAGLVRKKSAEAVKDHKKDSGETRNGSGEDPRSSAGSSKLLKSPPLKPQKDGPITPPSSMEAPISALAGSPWVLASSRESPPPTPTNSPGNSLGALPTIGENSNKSHHHRNRASLLSAFRMWFKEDPKGKRKAPPAALDVESLSYPQPNLNSPGTSPIAGRGRGTIKRRISNGRPKVTTGRKTGNRAKRGSMSSRRSSSINSRRSSITSAQVGILESSSYNVDYMPPVSRQRSDPSRRSFGSHTPNSELDEFVSRPSSVHSFIVQQRHRKSPSASSAGSMYPGRTSSPLPKYHRRGGSGSSTRVVRQMQGSVPYKQSHLRSNSASSNHSRTSSRPGSLYELSETEEVTHSPTKFHRSLDDTPRRNNHGPTTFVAQKRSTPFSNPGGGGYLHSIGRSSWKKSWGMEPPGWQTRPSQPPTIEVLAISPAVTPGSIRDVFTGRQSMGDDSDWVDEDDDMAGYAGGLGQMPSSSSTTFSQPIDSPILSPPPRSGGSRAPHTSTSKRFGGGLTANSGTRNGRGKTSGRSPVGRSSPLPPPPESTFEVPPETRGGRRQLPTGRSGPAFRHPIQEEDEDEE
ncbi:hypothetical protein PHLCEN_2v6135 [Hermanssonia centrifuga]|uniref:Protein kinase domain-containing protein n=1 Tax=Hermanssonia centrifuga TaxID=98765 RepID=A0A2R6P0B5_9APHY|nr:hypothetical protein PHLCEN_2v6135 [Hermanssonia centrifuga]